jgi:CRISPR-associated protein Cmr4
MKRKLICLFTRTPLHVGTGANVGPTDQTTQKERHTGFPLIPGSTLKGGFAGAWTDPAGQRSEEGHWLFGSDAPNATGPGALQFSEAKLLAFPIRSARGSFAWITCPLILRRFTRDAGWLDNWLLSVLLRDDQALFAKAGPLALIAGQDVKIVLEDFALAYAGELPSPTQPSASPSPRHIGEHLKNLLPQDPVASEIAQRLVVVNDSMTSFFCQSAGDIVHHLSVEDSRGAARPAAGFSQENVPSETLFYATLNCLDERTRYRPKHLTLAADQAFAAKIDGQVFQFGADASTGLGFCTVALRDMDKPGS